MWLKNPNTFWGKTSHMFSLAVILLRSAFVPFSERSEVIGRGIRKHPCFYERSVHSFSLLWRVKTWHSFRDILSIMLRRAGRHSPLCCLGLSIEKYLSLSAHPWQWGRKCSWADVTVTVVIVFLFSPCHLQREPLKHGLCFCLLSPSLAEF